MERENENGYGQNTLIHIQTKIIGNNILNIIIVAWGFNREERRSIQKENVDEGQRWHMM